VRSNSHQLVHRGRVHLVGLRSRQVNSSKSASARGVCIMSFEAAAATTSCSTEGGRTW
jgi:hypothetical protein